MAKQGAALEHAARQAGIALQRKRPVRIRIPLVFTSWRRDVDVIMPGWIITLTRLTKARP
jgi:hypothetical protein